MQAEPDNPLYLQDEELTALESIYPGLVTVQHRSNEEGIRIALSIPVELPHPTSARIVSARQQNAPAPSLVISHLPPLKGLLTLPPSYPISSPPQVIALRAPLPQGQERGSWLSRRIVSVLQERLEGFWQQEKELGGGEGTGVLWRWWEWISTGDFLQELGFMQGGEITLSTPVHLPASSLHLCLRSYNAQTSRADFESTAFPCEICFESPKGKKCFKLPECGCVFCHACLSSFWTLAIQEGTLQSVACPSVACVKKRGGDVDHSAGANAEDRKDGISAEVVESVVGKELTRRWRLLSEKRLVDTDPTYTFCPRAKCQAPVPKPSSDAPAELTKMPSPPKVLRLDVRLESPSPSPAARPRWMRERTPPSEEQLAIVASRWDNFRKCPRCDYVFCLLCRCLWHGAHTPCEIRDVSAAVKEYLEADEAGKLAIEARLGPRGAEAIQALVRDYEREQLMLGWLSDNTTACPTCSTSIEKSEGCNHMTCARCATHFCYRCGEKISARHPYEHFNTPGKPCYNKLFDFQAEEQDFWIPFE